MLFCIIELQHAAVDFGHLSFSTEDYDCNFIQPFSTKIAGIRSIQPVSPEEDTIRAVQLFSTQDNDRSIQRDGSVTANTTPLDQETLVPMDTGEEVNSSKESHEHTPAKGQYLPMFACH